MTLISVFFTKSRHYRVMTSILTPPFPLRWLKIVGIVLAPFAIAGCIKYTPSRAELDKKLYERDGTASAFGSEEEFNAYERSLNDNLNTLIKERAYLLTADASLLGYVIGPGDVLQVDVFGFGDLKSDTEVSPQGTVALPLVGELEVGGRDIAATRKRIAGAYARYIRAPKVDVALKTAQANRVSVIGEVNRPGMYPLRRSGQLLTELLSEAGGKNQNASNRIILLPAPRIQPASINTTTTSLTSPPIAQTVGVEIEMEALIGRVDQRPLLVPLVAGDTIVVPEAGTFQVDGEVEKPGSYQLTSSTSVIGAIAAAGGLTYSANVKGVEIVREIGGGRKALATLDLEEVGLRGGRDIRLRAGDLVRVPSEPGLFFERQIVETLNGIFNGVNVSKRVN